MSRFLNRFQITEHLPKLIYEAAEYLLLISPYIKLNSQLKTALANKRNDKKFHLFIVYGKNEENRVQSLSEADWEFFKSFMNVEIRYHKRLHAKIYANESNCLLTSMNLHEYSMNENIEFGIWTESGPLDSLRGVIGSLKIFGNLNTLDRDAFNFCNYIIDKSTVEFRKEVEVRSKWMGLVKSFGEATVDVSKNRHGFCIRTGQQIPFNLQRPFTYESFQSWSQYKNSRYLEKFCHACGKPSQTTKARPVCETCYDKDSLPAY